MQIIFCPHMDSHFLHWARSCLYALLSMAIGVQATAQDLDGKQLYQTHCASCHGESGQGVSGAREQPLYGDRSLGELADYIDRTMPEGEPETCDANESRLIAEYIHGAFYTEIARVRNQPPRTSLLRMTNRQYRESVADLLSGFFGRGNWSNERGLTGAYRDGKWQGDLNRVDPVIDFHFGTTVPPGIQSEKEDYVIQWQGGIRSLDSGDYEFHVTSTNGFELWVNDMKTPLIDAAVKSGDISERVGSIRLLANRDYPIRLQMKRSKTEQGNITLEWKPPNQNRQIVPKENLSPGWFPQVAVVRSPFPPDDNSYGYERGSSISKEWKEATIQAAIEVADIVVANIEDLAHLDKSDGAKRDEKLLEFCRKFVYSAHRGRLSDDEVAAVVSSYWDTNLTEATRVKKIVMRSLLSPDFLYQPDPMDRSPRAVALRLALSFWDSLPDQELWKAVYENRLHTEEQIRAQADRMVHDERATSKLRYFLARWIQLDRVTDISKDKELYPDFDAILISDLRTSLDKFFDHILLQGNDDYRQLLLADYIFANKRIADYYGLGWTEGDAWQKLPVDNSSRSGILTHPFLMAGFAYQKSSSPIHRGVFLARKVLGRNLPNPPVAVAALDESINPNLTTRERVMLQTKPESCQACHTLINSLGFSLENYDAVGRFRNREKDKEIDASGIYRSTAGDESRFVGPRELAQFIAGHHDAHEAFVEQLFHHSNQQPVFAYGPTRLEELTTAFAKQNFSIRSAFVNASVIGAMGPPNYQQ
jgi:Protein of unknown function (DUF1592)/Protein of unknown function (DUF1588)/PA14 domain/Cytochrome C oxidase, cbb3-type, subunit III